MVIIAYHSKDSLFQDRHKELVSLAKERLKAFPRLNRIFKNFEGYEKLVYKQSRNIVFVTCCTKPDGSDEEGYPAVLRVLEAGLKTFDVNFWTKEVGREFLARLTNFDYHRSESAMSEILTAYIIGETIGFDKVSPHIKLRNGKNADVLIRGKDREIVIEITSIGESQSVQKIRAAFSELARYVSAKCNLRNYAITIQIDAARLPVDRLGNISKEQSVSYLTSWADKLRLTDLIGITAAFRLDWDIPGAEGHLRLSELIGTEQEYAFPPGLPELIAKDQRVAHWASEIEIGSMNLCPFIAVFYDAESKGDFVEIQSEEFYPSAATIAQEGSFHRQLSRKIRDKMAGGQFEQGSPVVIMVKESIGTTLLFDGGFEEKSKVDTIIESELAKFPEISGVILYTRTISDGRYIENRNAQPSIRLSEDELAAFGFAE